MAAAVSVGDKLYCCDEIDTPFILGVFKPKIYVPSGLTEEEVQFVALHERAHLKRRDHWWKPLGFVLLAIYWFNPLLWLAYILLCRDIEDACDELVVKNMEAEDRKAYSEALLSCGKKSRKVFGCPVAFGEVSIRQRILNILSYRKPAVWVSIVLVAVMIFISVFFIPDPITQIDPPYYATLRDLLGQPIDVVCEELGISEGELVGLGDGTGYYDTPLKVGYQGVTFNVRLGFNISNNLLWSFTYYKTYEGHHEQAAADIITVSNRLWKNFGKGYQWYERDDPKRLKENTAEDVFKLCDEYLPNENGQNYEIAFFGGSFTAINRNYMLRLLETAYE